MGAIRQHENDQLEGIDERITAMSSKQHSLVCSWKSAGSLGNTVWRHRETRNGFAHLQSVLSLCMRWYLWLPSFPSTEPTLDEQNSAAVSLWAILRHAIMLLDYYAPWYIVKNVHLGSISQEYFVNEIAFVCVVHYVKWYANLHIHNLHKLNFFWTDMSAKCVWMSSTKWPFVFRPQYGKLVWASCHSGYLKDWNM